MTAELSTAARQVVDKIRSVIRSEPLDDALALRHARALIFRPLVGVSPEEEYDALVEALRSDAPLATWHGDPRFERRIDEGDFRAHLGRVRDRLDALRPWPVPLFRAVTPELWAGYRAPRVVGRIGLRTPVVEDRIHTHLSPVARLDGDGQVRVVILRLRSGHEIALVGRWWPDDLRATAVLTRDPDVPAEELMAELTSGDEFAPEEWDVLDPGPRPAGTRGDP